MNQAVIFATIAIYVALLVVIGVTQGRKSRSISDLTVGGRNAGAWLSALSYGTAYFSAVMFVGYAGGTGVKYGLWGVLAGLGNAVFGSFLAWKVLARRTREVSGRLKLKTMPEFFERRYNSTALRYFSSLVIFIFLIPYSASVYKGLASVAEVLLGIDVTVCMILIAVLAMLLLVLGGYLVQARADFVQGIIMMIGISLLIFCVVRCSYVGGISGLREYAQSDLGLPRLSGSEWVSLWATVLMTSFGTWGLPQMVQKYFGIKDDRQAKRGIIISTVFALLVAGGGYFIGSLCYRFFTPESIPSQDFVVPTMLSMSNLPNVLLGVVIVLLLSASVSTLCSVTLTAGSAVMIDLINRSRRVKLEEKKLSLLTKLLCVLFIICSYVVANTDTPILDMMSYSWGIISGSFLAPYVLALYIKKLNKLGAWCSVLTGFAIAIVPAAAKILLLCSVESAVASSLAAKGPLFACIAMIASCLVLVGVSLISSRSNGDKYEFFYSGAVERETT